MTVSSFRYVSWEIRQHLLTNAQVVKRIHQLTGHMIPSTKLSAVFTVETLLTILVRPAKARRLADELQTSGELNSLSNVTIYDRRITPIDKHKMVGRWKIIAEELEKRDLPVTGHSKYGSYVEKKWVNAAALAQHQVNAEKKRAKRQNR